ncbi:hypothetical protein PFICI_12060 [Pestalotiopsis fici W106-1]|uniref:Uncharacterized protein n=1 Tax=Pestalotiopsis fici (strain W106-1 / CGMCC3.15140) TaxID=1229662 RepID=W3WS54_PESFW|nr:uncharacterized protein PFICI_12060 [Pestalotiopsis fici W106-1]ETS76673.1 hypothetical protein PFICI_12060 [Pestalotiopsis fici W106-1]
MTGTGVVAGIVTGTAMIVEIDVIATVASATIVVAASRAPLPPSPPPRVSTLSTWPYEVETYDEPPRGSWSALSKEAFMKLWEEDRDAIAPPPEDRNTIYHFNCRQVHAPENCRGPLDRGQLNGCVYCGSKEHMADHCPYFLLVPEQHHDKLRVYLHVFARQGLPPAASRISFHRVQIGPMTRYKVPVLSRNTARMYARQQADRDIAAERMHWWKTFDYSRLESPDIEIQRLPQSCANLRKWSNSGPLPTRVGNTLYDLDEYGPDEESEPFNELWTVFHNLQVQPGPGGTRAVNIPEWVFDGRGQYQGCLEYPPPQHDPSRPTALSPPRTRVPQAVPHSIRQGQAFQVNKPEPFIKREPAIKREPTVKREPVVKNETLIKREPVIKRESE